MTLDDLLKLAQSGARGFTTGLLGGPVDIANMALGNAGGDKPVMGGKWIGDKLQGMGLLGAEPDSTAGSVAEFAGGLLGPGAPVKAAAALKGPALAALMFHGSPHKFDAFDLAKAGSTTDAGQLGRGIYFSTDKKVAEGYPHKYSADVDMKSPMHIEMPDFRTDKGDLVRKALGLPKSATAEEVTAAARQRGHDGVILDYSPTGYKQQEAAVFDDLLAKILSRE